MKLRTLALFATLSLSAAAQADNSTVDAAIGAGIGAAVGNEVGGREGAVLGGAIGAAIGTADSGDHEHRARVQTEVRHQDANAPSGHPGGYHCPPGQAKKGRC